TCFIDRCLSFCAKGASVALVTPQSWLYQPAYSAMRQDLLKDYQWNLLAKLGPRAFETISGEVVNVSLITISTEPADFAYLTGIEASGGATSIDKATGLRQLALLQVKQSQQLRNPEHRI